MNELMQKPMPEVMQEPWPMPDTGAPARRRIVFLGTAHDDGGSPMLGANLAAAMREQGHEVEDEELRARVEGELRRLSPPYAFETMAEQHLRLLD